MKTREDLELALSALIDHELEQGALLPTIDRLVDDGELRTFWREARALDALALDAAADESGESDSRSLSRIWDRIAHQAPKQSARSSAPTRVRSPWGGLAAAAALVLAALGGFWFGNAVPEDGPALASRGMPLGDDRFIEVVVGGAAGGGLDDRRFVEMTVELLSSDPRYHYKMREILDVVVADAPREGSLERLLDLDREESRSSSMLEAADALGADEGPML